MSRELVKRFGIPQDRSGNWVPIDLPYRRALDMTTGAGAVPSTIHWSSFIEAVHAKTAVGQLGARRATLAAGWLPRTNEAVTVRFVGDGLEPPGSFPGVGRAEVKQRCLYGRVRVSSLVMRAGDEQVTAFVLSELAAAFAAKLDGTALTGDGDLEPLGLFESEDIPTLAAGGDFGRSNAVEAIKTVALANGDASATPSLGWIGHPGVEAKLREVDVAEVSGRFLWSDEDTIVGRRAISTTNAPAGGLVYGDWGQVLLASAPATNFLIDQYTVAPDVIVSAWLWCDVVIRRNEAFLRFDDAA